VAHIEANGQNLYFEVHGEGEPLVCVMGLAANSLAWALQVQAFAERHRTVIFDNRDVGQSSIASAQYEIRDMAQDTLSLADALELDSFHLLGYSMGGAIAQEIALTAPDRVRTLTLAVTYAGSGNWGRTLSEVWGARRQRATREEHIDELMLLTLSEEFFENEAQVAYVREMMLADPNPQPPEAFARQLEASRRHDSRDRLGALGIPVHVIGCEYDILVPIWKQRELAQLIPNVQLTEIPRCAHAANIERAQEFNTLVLDFIAEHAAAAV
jgi:pimeloyl-ACP methyl ester carboxylesterase